MGIRVKAIQRGYYGDRIREPGEVFDIQKKQDFSKIWMVETKLPATDEEEAEGTALSQLDPDVPL